MTKFKNAYSERHAPLYKKRIRHRKSVVDRLASFSWLVISELTSFVAQESRHIGSVFSRTSHNSNRASKTEKPVPAVRADAKHNNFLDLSLPDEQKGSDSEPDTSELVCHKHITPIDNSSLHLETINQEQDDHVVQPHKPNAFFSSITKNINLWQLLLLRQNYRVITNLQKVSEKLQKRYPVLFQKYHIPGMSRMGALLSSGFLSLFGVLSTAVNKIGVDPEVQYSNSHHTGENQQSPVRNTDINRHGDQARQTNPLRAHIQSIKTIMKRYLPRRKQNKTPNKDKKQFWLWRWIKNAFLGGLVVGFIGMGVLLIWVATLEIPTSNIDDLVVAQSTKIYDSTGEVLLYDVFKDEKRTVVSLDEITMNMQKAILATEDDEFYEHGGYDVSAILRGVCYEISKVLQAPTFGGTCPRGGGSTITQQVIKNTLLNDDRRIERKVKELVLARKLEKQKTKDEILEIYLNEIAFGGPIYGVEQASLNLFGKNADSLSIAESAYLAALPKAPTTYLNNRDRFDGRQQFILGRMQKLNYITDAEYEQAINEEVEFVERVDKGIKAPHFVFHVLEQLDEQLSTDEEALNLGGYKIQTTLDWELQQKLEEITASQAERLETQYGASNLAVVAIENSTGKIKAMVGSKDYFAEDIDGKFNIATALRQPGSTFKPFVYASAFTKGYTPETILWDTPTEFSTSCYPDGTPQLPQYRSRCYSPQNYDKSFRGPTSIRAALAGSLNIPAVKALYLTGIGDSMKLAQELGISSLTRSPNFYGLNLVLGGGEVQLLEMVNAYSTFANKGVRHQIAAWEEVRDANGQSVDVYEDVNEQVLSANVAAMINSILSDDDAKRPVFGASSRLYYGNTPVAVKTGTTNNFRDVWTIGYSSGITIGVWAGNNDNTPLGRAPSSSVVGPFWREAMDAALETYSAKRFANYSLGDTSGLPGMLLGVYEGGSGVTYIDPETGEVVPDLTEEEIAAGLYQQVGTKSYNSILHTVNKTNPRTGAAQPGADSLYENFEYGVRVWTENKGWANQLATSTILDQLLDEITQVGGEVPGQNDGSENNKNLPFDFSIISPNGSVVVDGDDQFIIEIEMVGDVTDVETIYYYLNNSYLGSGTYRTTSMRVRPNATRDITQNNTVKVIVQKVDGTRIEKTAPLQVEQ